MTAKLFVILYFPRKEIQPLALTYLLANELARLTQTKLD
jgi:hypothetical protein